MLNSLKNKKVLVTSGPTWIAVDDMRVISNKSTGQLGKLIATDLVQAGAKVTLLQGPVVANMAISKKIKVKPFRFYDELFNLVKKELNKTYDIIVHAAAISDYRLRTPKNQKISSNLKTLKLELIPTPKIIHLIKKRKPKSFLVGFKLESHMGSKTAITHTQDLFEKAKCDLVIANSSSDQNYAGFVVAPHKKVLCTRTSRPGISKALVKILKEYV